MLDSCQISVEVSAQLGIEFGVQHTNYYFIIDKSFLDTLAIMFKPGDPLVHYDSQEAVALNLLNLATYYILW